MPGCERGEVSTGIYCQDFREPLGVVSCIVPFNFPVMARDRLPMPSPISLELRVRTDFCLTVSRLCNFVFGNRLIRSFLELGGQNGSATGHLGKCSFM